MADDQPMQDADPPRYPEPSPLSRTAYPGLLNDRLAPSLSPAPLYRSAYSENSTAARPAAQPWTTDFFNRLATPGNNRDAGEGTPGPSRGRKRGRPRGSASADGTTRGRRRGWRAALKGTEHADLFAKPKPKRSRGGKRGAVLGKPRASVNATGSAWIDPGVEFRELQGNANKAYLNGDLDAALDYAKMAVLNNSEVFMPHKMIHDIYMQQGKERDAVVALYSGANTKRDAEVWAEVGNRIMDFQDRNVNDEEWARGCFTESIRIKRDCYPARTGKLRLHEELQEWGPARLEAKALTEKYPDDLEMVGKYAELCINSGNSWEWSRAQDVYEKAFEAYADQGMLGDDPDQQWVYLNDYLDILLRLGLHQKGITQVKRMSRWFLGRKEDTFWDDLSDDREFDTTNERRLHLWQFQQGRISLDPLRYGDGLPLELRVKLGLFRLRMFAKDEAFRHFEHLLLDEVDVDGLEDVILEVADSLSNNALFSDAIRFYERIMPFKEENDERFWQSIAQCYNAIARLKEAEEAYLKVVKHHKLNIEARIQLARLYDATGQREKSFKMADEVTVLSKSDALVAQRPQIQHIVQRTPVPRLPPKPLKPLPILLPKPSSSDGDVHDQSGPPPVNAAQIPAPIGQPDLLPRPSPLHQAQNGNDRFGTTNVDNASPKDAMPNQTAGGAQPTPIKKKPKSTSKAPTLSLDARKAQVLKHYAVVKELWPLVQMEGGHAGPKDKEWMKHASAMATEFKSVHRSLEAGETLPNSTTTTRPSLLPQALVREMEKLKKRALGDGLWTEQDDHGLLTAPPGPIYGHLFDIPTSQWHRMLSDLALLYAKYVEQDKCYDILENCLMKAIIFRPDPELINTSQAVALYCTLLFNDSRLMTEVAQAYVLRTQKRSGAAFQFFAATGRLSNGGSSHLYDKKITKWLHDTINAADTGLQKARALRQLQFGADTAATDRDEEAPLAGLLTTCGHNAVHPDYNSSTRPALPFLLRALALQPDNLVINLSIATTYLSTAMRNSVTRLDDIGKAMAFLHRYYDLRVASGKAIHLQEAEYNVARFWHQLGLSHLAMPGYEKVLQMSEAVKGELIMAEEGLGSEDFTVEAAFALQRIYLDAENEVAARAIGEAWLVL